MIAFVFIGSAFAILMAGLGWYVSGEKNRDPVEGLILGLLFGPFGVLIVALLPSIKKSTPRHKHFTPARSSPWAPAQEMDYFGPSPVRDDHLIERTIQGLNVESENAATRRHEAALLRRLDALKMDP